MSHNAITSGEATLGAIEPTDQTRVRRRAERGVYDREKINAIIDEALFCHVGIVDEGRPVVIPTIHARLGDHLYLHGSPASRLLKVARSGAPLCVTVTLLDGLVLARSYMHHSMNYRSVVILGAGQEVTDPQLKLRVMHTLVEHVIRGRGGDARPANELETKATTLVEIPILEASAKVRTGPPKDDEEDYAGPHWAGVVPLRMVAGPPQPDPRLSPGIATPAYVMNYAR